MREPIAVVAAGVLTPIGRDLDEFWTSLLTGVSGISAIERFRVDDLKVGRGGEIKKVPAPDAGWGRIECRATRLLMAAAHELRSAAPDLLGADPSRVAVVLGTALGGIEEGDRALSGDASLRTLAAGLYDTPARNLAGWLGVRGPALTISTACASGATALGVGADLLRERAVDAVVAGGYDVLCRFVMRGFDVLRSLTRDEIRPFDRRRSGLLLGEGAGLVLLARDDDAALRGRARLGRLLGHASGGDGTHIAAPDPEGRGLERTIHAALAEAGIGPGAIEFVSAHGTGTPLNDRVETVVLKRVFRARAWDVPVNSIKPYMGHTMGAAATLEAIMCLLAARHGAIPPTMGLTEADPECDLDYVAKVPRVTSPRIMLSTSLGFGGCNATLVLEGA